VTFRWAAHVLICAINHHGTRYKLVSVQLGSRVSSHCQCSEARLTGRLVQTVHMCDPAARRVPVQPTRTSAAAH
jgi:hypothetical protein